MKRKRAPAQAERGSEFRERLEASAPRVNGRGATARADQVELDGPILLVLGAEGSGLRQLTRTHCDFIVSLPAQGAVESLNVSVAAGMLLYEAVRQRLTR